MTDNQNYKEYKEWIFKTSAYQMALSLISIDKLTVAPPGGGSYRDERTAFLAGELFAMGTDPHIIEVLRALKDDPSISDDDRKAVSLYYKNAMDAVVIPKDEFVAFEHLCAKSYDAWLKAKTENDYSIFAPYLKQVIEAKKHMYSLRQSDLSLYDRMLDDFEPGMNVEKYDAFFDVIRTRLVPFIQAVAKAAPIAEDFLHEEYDVKSQKAFTADLLKYLRFDPEWGYQNETEHPFTAWTCENDCRTTTKYYPGNMLSAIFSTIHEVGHAYYEHNCSPAYDGMILSEGISCGMHESQSRFNENYLGRSRGFWKYNYPILQKHMPRLQEVSFEDFMKAINVSHLSLVRTEADELTYPLHILVRYEIEKGLFNGDIDTEHLDTVWNDMYRKYLGVEVPDAAHGILQDVHWSDGSFGYFPTYALGSAFAAQFFRQMQKDMDVEKALAEGRYDLCMGWLKEHIHQYGCRYDADEIMHMVTGQAFDPNVYIDYLIEKFSAVYGIDYEKTAG